MIASLPALAGRGEREFQEIRILRYRSHSDRTAGQINPVAFALLNYKLPNGQYLIPSANPNFTPTLNLPGERFLTQPAYFISDQAVIDLDYLATSKDTLSLKYYYQHDPTTAPYAYSSVEGFPQHLDAGSQVASITNTQTFTPNLSLTEVSDSSARRSTARSLSLLRRSR